MSRDLLAGHPAWRYRLHVLIVRLGTRLPGAAVRMLAWAAGGLAWWLDPRGRRYASRNLACLRAGSCRFERELLALAAYRSFCLMLADNCRLLCRHAGRDLADRVRIVDPWGALTDGGLRGPVVVATAHANWEPMAAALLRLGACSELHSAVLTSGDPRLDAFLASIRAAYGHRGVRVPGAGAVLRRELARGGIVALAADRDYTGRGRMVAFGAGQRRLPRGPVVLARRCGAPILPVLMLRRECGSYILFIGKELRSDPDTPERALQQRLAAILCAFLRLDPRQWVAFHRENTGYDRNRRTEAGPRRDPARTRITDRRPHKAPGL